MNTTAATTNVTVGQGTTVHAAIVINGEATGWTACGAEGRGYRQSRIRPTTAELTCKRCATTRNEARRAAAAAGE